MIKKIKKLYYAIMYYYYDLKSRTIGTRYWIKLDKEKARNINGNR